MVRTFVTDNDLLKNLRRSSPQQLVQRESRYNPDASKLIKAIRSGDYNHAKQLTKTIHVDSHDWKEDTPLTDAASRGDMQGVQFLINDLGANPHASCDCPYHKTALHYASENGHANVVKMLLSKGAKPNVLDSRNYTALDVAKNQDTKKYLLEAGGCKGNEVKERVAIPRTRRTGITYQKPLPQLK